MSDWRERLGIIAGRKKKTEAPTLDDARRRLRWFIETTVMPAFEALEVELRRHGREVVIDRRPYQVSLSVHRDGREEFSYAVRGRAFHKMSFAFPELGEGDDAPRILRGEIVRAGGSDDYDVQDFTTEGIIRDFVEAYDKWMGW